jgi:hypothetical protein
LRKNYYGGFIAGGFRKGYSEELKNYLRFEEYISKEEFSVEKLSG